MYRFRTRLVSLKDRSQSLQLGQRPLRDAEGNVAEVLPQFGPKDQLIAVRDRRDLQQVDITP